MKILDAIAVLHEIFTEHGDLELVSITDVEDGACIDHGREFHVAILPGEDDEDEEVVCAFVDLLKDDHPRNFSLIKGGLDKL